MVGEGKDGVPGWNGTFKQLAAVLNNVLDDGNHFHRCISGLSAYYEADSRKAFAKPYGGPGKGKERYCRMIELLNEFGHCHGFEALRDAALCEPIPAADGEGEGTWVTAVQMACLVRPFGGRVARMLTRDTIAEYFAPVRERLTHPS